MNFKHDANYLIYYQKKNDLNKWAKDSLEEIKRVTEDRTAWCKISCAAGTANVRTDDVDQTKVKCVPVETWVRYAMCFDSPFSRTSSDLRKLFV